MSFIKAQVIGNLGKNPNLRYTPQGNAVCDFSVAVNDKDKNGVESTEWVKVVLWGKQAELASTHLVKGGSAYFEGRLKLEGWTDRDGKERTTLVLNCSDMQFLPKSYAVTGDEDSAIGRPTKRGAADSSEYEEDLGF